MTDCLELLSLHCDEERLSFTVSEYAAGKRLVSALRVLGFGRTLIRQVRASGRLIVNGEDAFAWQPLERGDAVTVVWPQPTSTSLSGAAYPSADPEPIPLAVLYEDDHVLAVDKPAGMVVHPVRQYRSGTLANAVSHHLITQGLIPKVRPLHRLDRGTSGIVLFAKHPYSLLRLTHTLQTGLLHREYVAIATGSPGRPEGWIDLPLRRAEGSIILREVAPPGLGKRARTHFRVAARTDTHCIVRLQLETGRTHQIRVHMAAIGHALVGDGLYGKSSEISRPALHATRLGFPHPVTGKRLELVAPLPEDLKDLSAALGLPA